MYTIYNHTPIYKTIVKDDGSCIPMDESNSDYQQYLAWLAEGNTPEEWQPDIVQSNETP
jgi:hypothetical protein